MIRYIRNKILLSALISMFFVALSAQTRSLPQSFHDWLKTPALRHATVTLEVARLSSGENSGKNYTTVYQYDSQRLMIPASVMKLVTTATALRLLGGDYVMPDSVALIDTAAVALPGLEAYNKDWMIEDIGEDYIPPLQNQLPDSGRVLREVVRDTNVESLNNQAETLLRLLHPNCLLDSALLVVSDYWKSQGLDTDCLVMYDGCGLAPSDRVTSHFIIGLLALMRNDQDFVNSLPVAGKEGTVRRFLLKSRLDGRAQLKTGTTKSVVAYAGYVRGTDEKLYAVSIFVNSFAGKTQPMRKGIEKVLLSLIP